MKKVWLHSFDLLPPIWLALVILIVPQLNNPELMNATQSSKAFGFIGAMLGFVPVALIISVIKRRIFSVRITIVDILLGLYCLMVITSYWIHPIDYLQMITFGALILFYLSIRVLNPRYYILLLFAVIVSGLIQAIYGNLQLYDIFHSNHGLFKMTGSFFNPGPYAGYLAAILPVAVGLYFSIVKNVSIVERVEKVSDVLNGLSERNSSNSSNISNPSYISNLSNRIPFISRFFYNTHTGVNTPEEQAHRISHILDTIINLLLLLAILAMCLVLPASRSRAAWLAVMVSAGYLLSVKYNLLLYIWSTFNTVKKRFFFITSIVIIIGITCSGLYYFKKDSADGRLLIWKVSGEMIKEKPFLGHGAGRFEANYMNYQAAYFKPNPDIDEAIHADNVTYAYNELLKITVEHGFVGLLLSFALIWSFFCVRTDSRETNRRNLSFLAARGSLLSVLAFSLFSYPSDILPIRMLFVLFIAIVAYQSPVHLFQLNRKETIPIPSKKVVFVGSSVLYAVLAVVLLVVYPASGYLMRQYQAYKSWKDASDIYNVGAYPECLENFEIAYPLLKYNGIFLVQCGKAFEMAEKYERSIEILDQAKGYLNNTILYTCLGNSYKTLGKHAEAERVYLHAWNMSPARFYPLYLLVKLYDGTGQQDKAVTMAKKVIEKEVKIESTAIKEIQEEMRKIIGKGDAVIFIKGSTKIDKNLTPIYKGTNKEAYPSVELTDQFMRQKW